MTGSQNVRFLFTNLRLFSQDELIKQAKRSFSAGQTTDWVGRTVAALLSDENIEQKAGRVIWCFDVSKSIFLNQSSNPTPVTDKNAIH